MRPFLLDDWPPCGDMRRPSKPPRPQTGDKYRCDFGGDAARACRGRLRLQPSPYTLRNHANSKAPIIPISWPCPETTTRATNHTLCNKSSQFGLLEKGGHESSRSDCQASSHLQRQLQSQGLNPKTSPPTEAFHISKPIKPQSSTKLPERHRHEPPQQFGVPRLLLF